MQFSFFRHLSQISVALPVFGVVPGNQHINGRQNKQRKGGAENHASHQNPAYAVSGACTRTLGKDVDAVYRSMKADGLQVRDGAITVQELARVNNKPLDAIMKYFVQ